MVQVATWLRTDVTDTRILSIDCVTSHNRNAGLEDASIYTLEGSWVQSDIARLLLMTPMDCWSSSTTLCTSALDSETDIMGERNFMKKFRNGIHRPQGE